MIIKLTLFPSIRVLNKTLLSILYYNLNKSQNKVLNIIKQNVFYTQL